MLEVVLSEADLVDVRFAISPLNEVTLSLRVLNDPGRYPLHLPWIHRVRAAADRLDLEVLDGLTNERGWTPDFLSPRPGSPLTRFSDELRVLRATPPEVVRSDVYAVHRPPPAVLDGPPRRVLERVADAVEGYWHEVFEDNWDRMRSLLEADLVYRGRMLAQSGVAAMLADLSDRVTFDPPVLRIGIPRMAPRRTEARGAGLTLVPSVFALHTAVPADAAAPPLLIYAARGVGTLWEHRTEQPPGGLAGVLGRTRAGLLAELTEPRSSTDVARRNGVTTTAANQHLRALRDAGLLTSYRHGHSVLYARSELGDALVTASAG